jgi:hypothetical protein
MPENTDLSAETRQAGQADAEAAHRADRAPTEAEERVAEAQDLDPKVAESYKEAAERGANAEGEGRI